MRRLVFLARIAFGLAIAASAWLAFSPPGEGPPLLPWDKAQHFLCFFVLTGLGLAAWPKIPIAALGSGLLAYGAAIELVQAIPVLQRDAELADLLTDAVGIGAALACWLAAEVRRRSA